MYQTISAVLIVAVVAGLGLYDLLPATNDTPNDTISSVLRSWSREWWCLAYLWGVLGAHFFAGHTEPVFSERGDAAMLIYLSWACLIVNICARGPLPTWGYALLLVAGGVTGHFFWSQV